MLSVVSSVVVFPIVIGLLTIGLLAAEARLRPQRKVKIVINGDSENALETATGSTLLSTLSSNGVLLPSACGGGGTCGVCKCQVLDGAGDILPTEQQHINFRDAKENWRLSCQVKVREDMQIQVPDEVFSINKWECEVLSNNSVATFIKELVLKLPEGEQLGHQSGGYIQIEVPPYNMSFNQDINIEEEYRDDWNRMGLFELNVKNSPNSSRVIHSKRDKYSVKFYGPNNNIISSYFI